MFLLMSYDCCRFGRRPGFKAYGTLLSTTRLSIKVYYPSLPNQHHLLLAWIYVQMTCHDIRKNIHIQVHAYAHKRLHGYAHKHTHIHVKSPYRCCCCCCWLLLTVCEPPSLTTINMNHAYSTANGPVLNITFVNHHHEPLWITTILNNPWFLVHRHH